MEKDKKNISKEEISCSKCGLPESKGPMFWMVDLKVYYCNKHYLSEDKKHS